MPFLYPSKEKSFGGGYESLPVKTRLRLEVEKSGLLNLAKALFDAADEFVNTSDLSDWRGSEIMELPNDNPHADCITYLAIQDSLQALVKQEHRGLAVTIKIKYQMLGGHKLQISGEETTFDGLLPKSFNPSDEVEKITDALTQAMLNPKALEYFNE